MGKLRQIEEIATRQVPVWQPVLLAVLLLLGFFVVPLITREIPPPSQKKTSFDIKQEASALTEELGTKASTVMKPLSYQLQKQMGVVLGIAEKAAVQTAQDVASRSATQAQTFVFDSTLGKILQNVKSLPKEQQQLIKKAICK